MTKQCHLLSVVTVKFVLKKSEDMMIRMTTCPENLEMSGNLTDVREMSGILLKVREVSAKKFCQGKVA